MGKSRTPWVRKDKRGPGYFVEWYTDEGRRKRKKFPNKGQADRYAADKLKEIRSELQEPNELIPITLPEMLEEYRTHMAYEECRKSAITRRFLAINTFVTAMDIKTPKHLTPANLEQYIAEVLPNRKTRFGRLTAPATIHHDKGHLKAFIRWALDKRYIAGRFNLKMKTIRQWRMPKSLPAENIAKLLALFNDDSLVEYPDAWRTRIILAICTGQRRGVIEALTAEKFSVLSQDGQEHGFLQVIDTKSGNPSLAPINDALWPCVAAYIQSRQGKGGFWPDCHESKKWERICKAMGWPYPGFRYHDLRKVFASAMQAIGAPTGVTQKFLNHATSKMTNDVYSHFDPALRVFAQLLPGQEWVKDVKPAEKKEGRKKKAWRPRPREETQSSASAAAG